MSDDVNKSNKKVNGEIPKRFEDLFSKRDYKIDYSTAEAAIESTRLGEQIREVEKLRGQVGQSSPYYQSIIENLGQLEADKVEAIDQYQESANIQANRELQRSLTTATKFGNVNSRTTTMSSQARFGRMAKSDPRIYQPTEMIEMRNRELMMQVGGIGESMADQATTLGVGETTSAELGGGALKIKTIEEEIALNKRLLKTQARQGLSTEKLINRGEDLDAAVQNFIGRKNLEQKVDSGDVKSYSEEFKKMEHIRSNRNKLQEEYNDAIDNGSDMAGIFAEKLKRANDALDEQTRVVKRMSDKGMDRGGDFFGKYGSIIQGAAFAGNAMANIAGNVKVMSVDQDLSQMNNRAAFAAMGNRLYGKAESAVFNNDVDAALEVASSFGTAADLMNTNRKIANTAGGIGVAGRAIGNIGGGAMKGAAIGTAAGTALGGVLGGVFGFGAGAIPMAAAGGALGGKIGGWIGGINGLSDTATEAGDLLRGNVGARASIATFDSFMNLSAQQRKIQASQMQKFMDQGVGIYNQSTGLGNAQAFSAGQNLMSDSYLRQLQDVGISATGARNLLPTLRNAGSFNFENEALPAMMSAGRMKQAGVMGEQEYMTAFSRMRAMGGGDEDLQKIITAGFENAKNINQMVDASIQMSTGLANLGVSGVGSTADMMTANVQALKGIGVDPNVAIGMAANNMANYNKQITDQGFNLGNVVEMQKLRRDPNLAGASVFQLRGMASMSAQEHKILRDAVGADQDSEEYKQARMLARNKGISDLVFDANGGVRGGSIRGMGAAALEGALLNVGSAGQNKAIMDNLMNNKDLTDKQRAILSQAGFTQETAQAALGVKETQRTEQAWYLDRDGKKLDQNKADRERRNIAEGKGFAEKLDPGKKAFENMENLMRAVSEIASPEKMGAVTAKAAESFRPVVGEFGTHVGTMGTVLKNVIEQQNMMLRMMGESRGVDFGQLQSREK